jgi:hypothetical protein
VAIVTRYFSTADAGTGDGTTWANRAELLPSGNWDTIITGFAFNGTDSLKCMVGPGSYTCSQQLATGLFANAPTNANPLTFAGCDSSGVALEIPDPGWVSCEPAWDDSTLPVIATTTNVGTSLIANWYLIKMTASGRNGYVLGGGSASWCVLVNTTANSSAIAASGVGFLESCVCKCTGSSYDVVVSQGNAVWATNTRIEGVAGSSGNRRGFAQTGNGSYLTGVTVVNCGGAGIEYTGTSTGQFLRVTRCVVANNAGSGIKSNSTASQTLNYHVAGCLITGNGAYGIDAQSEGQFVITQNRLRDNTSGNTNGTDNYPIDLGNYTTDSDDASEYVSTGADGDFRVNNGATIHGMGFGVADEPAAGGSGGNANIFGGSVIR